MLKTYTSAKVRLENLRDRFLNDDGGAALVEYTILLGIITVGAIATIGLVGTWVSTHWTTLNTNIQKF